MLGILVLLDHDEIFQHTYTHTVTVLVIVLLDALSLLPCDAAFM